MVNQKTATYNAIKTVCKELSISHEDGQVLELSKDARKFVSTILIEGFQTKQIELSKTYDDKQLKDFVSGLVSNWLRKDTRFNGGIQYTAKNPGSRSGSTDPQIKALKAVQALNTDPDKIKEIQSYIDARLTEIGQAKKVVQLNVEDLPADLRAKLGL